NVRSGNDSIASSWKSRDTRPSPCADPPSMPARWGRAASLGLLRARFSRSRGTVVLSDPEELAAGAVREDRRHRTPWHRRAAARAKAIHNIGEAGRDGAEGLLPVRLQREAASRTLDSRHPEERSVIAMAVDHENLA